MPSFFRKRRSTATAPSSPPPVDMTVDVEPLALHKLRTLLHRGSRLSLRLGHDDDPVVHSASVQVGLDDNSVRNTNSSSPNTTRLYRRSAGDLGRIITGDTGSEDTDTDLTRRKVDGAEMPALAHKSLSPPESATVSPPNEACQLPDVQQPSPEYAHIPPSPTPPNRPSLTVDTGAVSPSDSPFHTPAASPVAEQNSLPSEQTPTSHTAAPLWPTQDLLRSRSGGSEPMHIPARRRSSAVSANSAGSPRRMAAVLHSPPMPIPITRLPSISSTAGSPPGQAPGWGALALEGGPRSPELSRSPSRSSATTATGGFPLPVQQAPAAPQPASSNKEMTDAEVRRATKSMPVMLRVPSRQEPQDEDDGGDAEDDEDDDDDLDDDYDDVSERSTAAPLRVAPKGSRALAAMEPVTEESRAGTPTSSVPSPRPNRIQSYFEHDRPSSALGTPSSTGVQSTAWSGISAPADDDSSIEEGVETSSMDDAASGSVATSSIMTPASSTPPLSTAVSGRAPMYTQTSHSMINLSTPRAERTATLRPSSPDHPLQTVDEVDPASTPALDRDWARPPATPATPYLSPPPLKRRLSAGEAEAAPPKYESVRLAHDQEGPSPKPREEEGKERLPGYWCGVHIEGTLARKMEFMQPGVQAKDRGWKKYYFVLHGTALFVYKFDPSKVPLRAGEPYLTCDEHESHQFLHVHLAPEHHRASVSSAANAASQAAKTTTRRATVGLEAAPRTSVIANAISNARRGTIGSHTPTRREMPSDGNGEKNPALFQTQPTNRRQSSGADSVASSTASAPIASHMPFAHNQLLHVYSMHAAESGLAADYKKRLHCVRVRAEGQQFKLQTDTARQCVQWIEAFQAATNVAMDLDTRPMPVQQTLPRRRRRAVRRAPAAEAGAAANGDGAVAAEAFADTPEGNIAAVIEAERRAQEQETERERMLAEDQAAESQGRFRI